MTEIKLAKYAGFCSGVESAFSLALSLAKKGERVFTFGELIHNNIALSKLADAGVGVINSVDEVRSGDTIILRTHGTSEKVVAKLKQKGATVVDATCPFVKKIHKIVKEYYEKGYRILIAGESEHAEVKGINSYANDEAIIFSDTLPPILDTKKYCLVFQTTFSLKKYEKIIEETEKLSKDSHKTVVYFNTICYTTKGRQTEVERLSQCSDAVVVVGSRKSANTNRLYDIAKQHNKNVYFIEKSDELPFDIKQFFSIAIVSGASTPKWLLEEVVCSMSEAQNDKAVEVNVAANDTEMTKEATSSDNTKVETIEETFSMEDIINDNSAMGFTSYTPGKRVKGTVIGADEAGIRVALGGKKDGFIAKEDATLDNSYNPEDYNPDDEIEAIIVSQDREKVQLSKKEVDQRKLENEEAEQKLSQDVFELTMTEVVKGGLRGRMGGYTVFVPASHIKIGYVNNLDDYKGKKLRLMILPPKNEESEEETKKGKRKSRYIFASQRMVLEKEKKEREDAFWNSIHVHDIVVGKVKRFTSIGAFVNVKGYDCLCHISEISWNTISDPSTVLTLNESYDFVVLKMDRESGKISLGYKQLQKKPYELAAEKYPVGSVIEGTVARIKSYGAFVQIEEGVDGLVHVSQIAHTWVKDANEVFQIGQPVKAKIINFEDNRITLSMKELLPPPEETETVAEEGEEVELKPSTTKRPSRVKKFEEALANSEAKQQRGERRSKRADSSSNEPKEWISNSGTATLGDLFKGLDLKFDDDKSTEKKETKVKAEKVEDKAEEKVEKEPAKKTAKKADTEKAEEVKVEVEVEVEKPAKKVTKKADTTENAEEKEPVKKATKKVETKEKEAEEKVAEKPAKVAEKVKAEEPTKVEEPNKAEESVKTETTAE